MAKPERTQRRLSKPRSLKHSTSSQLDLLTPSLEGSSPLTSSGLDYFGVDTVTRVQGTGRSKSKSRSKIRAYLYGNPTKSLIDASSDEDASSPSSHVSEATRKAKNRLSRSGSIFTQRSSARDSTTLLANTQATTANTKDDDDLEDTETVANQIKQRAQHDSLAADNHKHLPDDEDAHCDSFLPPIRRKSLFTPGLATRNVSDILRKPCAPSPSCPQSPLSDADLDYYYDKSHPADSPLSCLAALKLPNDGRGTPSSLNIPNIGGLKHGTLRVTNGIGSPAPISSRPVSICHSPTLSHTDRDTFHTASEGSICDIEDCSSPVPILLRGLESPPTPPDDSTPTQRNSDSRYHARDTVLSDHSALSSAFALDYIAELADTPFSQSEPSSRPDSPVLGTKRSDIIVPSTTFQSPPVQAHDIRTSTIVSYFNPRDDNQKSSTVTRLSRPLPGTSRTIQTTTSIMTSDSGYHSSESLDRSETHKLAVRPEYQRLISLAGEHVVEPDFYHGHLSANVAQSAPVRPEAAGLTATRAKAGARKLQKERPKKVVAHSHSLADSSLPTSITNTSIPRVPSAMAVRHAQRLVEFPVLEQTYPSSAHVNPAKSPELTCMLPVKIEFPEVSTDRVTPLSIPAHVKVNDGDCRPRVLQSRRWSSFGTSGKHVDNKKLVKKIEEARRKEERNHLKRLEQEKEERERDDYGESKTNGWRSRATSRVRGRSVERRSLHSEPSGTIADLGTVAHSIGCSPYDIATSINPRAIHGRPGCSPHQLGALRPRPRSFVGMDDLTASEFAHARSRQRQQPVRDRPKTICSDRLNRNLSSDLNLSSFGSNTVEKRQFRKSWSTEDRSSVVCDYIPATNEHAQTHGDRMRFSNNASDRADPRAFEGRPRVGAAARHKPVVAYGVSPPVRTGMVMQDPKHDFEQSGFVEDQKENSLCPTAKQKVMLGSNESAIDWHNHRTAWRQRRKSAGNALRSTQLASNADIKPGLNDEPQVPMAPDQRTRETPSPQKAAVSPTIAMLAGRYEGGFDFGFERGCGVGGSAGTRNLGNAAARKSGDVSKGYGLDLSDLPVFVAHAPR